MTENTVQNGTVDDVAAREAYVAKLIAKDVAEQARKDAAKAKRERANDRPFILNTQERMNASQASYTVLAQLLANWCDAYKNDPESLVRRVSESLVPVLTQLGNTDSLQMSVAQDGARHTFAAWKVPTAVQPAEKVDMPGKAGK